VCWLTEVQSLTGEGISLFAITNWPCGSVTSVLSFVMRCSVPSVVNDTVILCVKCLILEICICSFMVIL
jgi:hypothetical protein